MAPPLVPVALKRDVLVLLLPAVIAAVVVGIYFSSYANIASMWMLSTYGHGWFIVPFSAFMLWQRREALAKVSLAPNWIGVAMLAGIAIVWHLARATAVQGVEQACAISAVPVAVLAVMGWRFFKAAAFPLLLLLAAIPVGEALIPYLMHSTAKVAEILLTIAGVPFERRGMMLSLPGGDFEVADICSGLKYLLASLTLSLILSYYIFNRARARVIFVIATAGVFVLGNGVRAFIVMVVASATNMEHFAGHDHVVFGMFFFVVLLALMCWVGYKFADQTGADEKPLETGELRDAGRGQLVLVGCAAVVALLVGPAAQAYHHVAAATLPKSPALPAPSACSGPNDWSGSWSPTDFADAQTRGSYRCGDMEGHVLIATYVKQHQGKELVNSSNPLLPTDWIRENERSETQVKVEGQDTLSVKELAITDSGRAIAALYWYSVNGTPVDSAFSVKVQEALAALTMRPAISRAYVVVAIGAADEPARVHNQAVALAQAAWRGAE